MSNEEKIVVNLPQPTYRPDQPVKIERADYKIHPWNTRNYRLNSMQSLIDVVIHKGNPEKTVVFYNTEGVQVIFDDTIMDRPQDHAIFYYELSDAGVEWYGILGKRLDQKEFLDFLRRRPEDELAGIESLMARVQNLKLATEIVGDYEYDDHNNMTFMFKTKDGEGSMQLPREMELYFTPLYDGLSEVEATIELELIKPKSENEKPGFVLRCPKWKRYLDIAKERELENLRKMLSEYLILAGNTV